VIDAYLDWDINPLIPEQRETYFSQDSIHPNDKGHQYIAERFLEYFENL
jgi:lysophospholipase L1-like esterase